MVTGASGGPLIVTTLAQILINRFWFNLGYDQCIQNLRLHHQLIPNRIQYESHNQPSASLFDYLGNKGHSFEAIYRCRRSAANAIFVSQADDLNSNVRTITAIGDSRKYGGVAGY
ncbi:hypothetical protein MXB_769 [Myxobolus squamalis]|nr:hypothetical protein MXB_769 [Myxobolus squamalis]